MPWSPSTSPSARSWEQSLTLAIDVWTREHRLIILPTLLAVLGVFLMLAACVNLVREALEAAPGQPQGTLVFSGAASAAESGPGSGQPGMSVAFTSSARDGWVESEPAARA